MSDSLQIRVSLRGVSPEVWRRLVVPADCDFGQLHELLMAAMGWQGGHLHQFHVGELPLTAADSEAEEFGEDERGYALKALVEVGGSFDYLYDFGDSWEHTVVVEAEAEEGAVPRCLDGERACPPEDCGGPERYQEICAALADSARPDAAELLEEFEELAGSGFDPEHFDVAEANAALAELASA